MRSSTTKRWLTGSATQGVGQAFSVNEVAGGTLIISAHGIAPNVIEEAKSKGLNVIDATCPLVTRIYNIVDEGDRERLLCHSLWRPPS